MSILSLPLPAGYGLSATECRELAGKSYLGQWSHLLPRISTKTSWLRGSDNQLSRIPYHIAVKLDNRQFSSFNAFRIETWKLIAADPFVCNIYSDEERKKRAVKKGIAPLAPEMQQINKTKKDSYIYSGAIKHQVVGSSFNSVILESERSDESLGSYQLHHHHPIHNDGGVYEISNIIIVTPLLHTQLLSADYHYGRNSDMPEWKQEYIQKQIDTYHKK